MKTTSYSKEQIAQNKRIVRQRSLDDGMTYNRYFFKERESNPFIVSPHHQIMQDTLDKVYTGEISKLIINVPPGYTKTELAVIHFITRGLAKNPRAKFIHASYSDDLASLNSTVCRDIISSHEYQELWPMAIRQDTAAKKRWFTEHGGGMMAVAYGGAITGFRAGRMEEGFHGAFIIDDPIKPEDAQSDAIRTRNNKRYNSTIKSRLALSSTPVIVIMQRVHEDDLAGFLLKGGSGDKWHHLLLPSPMPADIFKNYPKDYTHGILIDPKLPEGPLWPMKHDAEALKTMDDADPYTTSSQYAQNPSPKDGGIFKRKWWQFYEELPMDIITCIIYCDTAQKVKEIHDYSVFQCWGLSPTKGIFLIDNLRGKWEAPELEQNLVAFWDKHKVHPRNNINGAILIKIEDKSSGSSLIQSAKRRFGLPIDDIQRNTDKVMRSWGAAPQIKAGNVHLPLRAEWLNDYLSEFDKFSALMTHSHDDQIDPTIDAIDDLLIEGKYNLYAHV